MPIVKTINGNLAELHRSGKAPLIALCLNSVDVITEDISRDFPEVVDVVTNFNMPSIYRLGDYVAARTETGSVLVFFSHLLNTDKLEYSAIKSCLKKLSGEAIANNMYIELAVSKISDDAQWAIIKKLLNMQEYLFITVVDDQGEVQLGEGEAGAVS